MPESLALEGAMDDGVIHEQERAVLDVLREQLQITLEEARRLEEEAAGHHARQDDRVAPLLQVRLLNQVVDHREAV